MNLSPMMSTGTSAEREVAALNSGSPAIGSDVAVAALLTSGRLLARNTVWNVMGQLLPMVVAVVTVPPLIRHLGIARFGVLSMAWIVIGYFSLFDLGIGRALTKLVADKIGADQHHEIPPLAWTALMLMFALGIFGGAVTSLASPWLIYHALKVPSELQTETLKSFYLLALSIPLVTVTSGLRGILEAQQKFKVLNLIRVPMSVFSFAGPLLVLPFTHSLVGVVGILVAGRFVGYLAHQFACLHSLRGHRVRVHRGLVAPLLRIGSWMTMSNLLGPLTWYVDRFIIGAVLSLGAVAYYTTPFDAVSRLLFVPAAISGVLFPAFAVSMVQDPVRTGTLLNCGLKYTFLIMFPVALFTVGLAPDILRLWLGVAFAEHSTFVLRCLALGILLNAVTVIPFALLQGIGRPDLTGKVLLIDLIVYSGLAWILIRKFGIDGAAAAWSCRAGVEFLVFSALSYRFLPQARPHFKAIVLYALGILSLYFLTIPGTFAGRAVVLIVGFIFFSSCTWVWILDDRERTLALRYLRRVDLREAEIASPAS